MHAHIRAHLVACAAACMVACAAPGGEIGDGCLVANHCRTRLCVPNGATSICSEGCATDCDCPTGYECTPSFGGGLVCTPGHNACGECEPACDDGSACTTDRCGADLVCSFEPVTDHYTGCVGETGATACVGGVSTAVYCPQACLDNGSDGYRSCGSGSCRCVSLTDVCTPGASTCGTLDGLTFVGVCLSAAEAETTANVWRFRTCLDVCRDRGGSWTGRCEPDPGTGREVCFCTV